ncbi:hypothetical protein OCU04_011043 [Sclerotinia nivalis]|uniref:Uncharacterized protein n=1 Tax=Sclerotinia nivalis TaxID=352851 RepID=A0A9X0DFB8_9HELO|nr:hypothetical protein OCU04_011043 [Sclerotinia nivalis]
MKFLPGARGPEKHHRTTRRTQWLYQGARRSSYRANENEFLRLATSAGVAKTNATGNGHHAQLV